MTTLEAVRSYIDAWNGRSCQAVLESMAPTGTYRDPTTLGPLAGDALRAHLTSLWQSFPDLSFEVVSLAETGDGRAAFEWNMRGTNTGPFRGLPPTGKPVELAGADFVVTDGAKVQAVTGYFDGAAVPRQLGLQVVIQPDRIGPFSFGDSTQVQTGARRMPGAMGITVLHAADEDQAANIRADSREILADMLGMEGFIGATVGKIGRRMFTISAWDSPERTRQLLREGKHSVSMPPFFGGQRATSGFTSVWIPVRVNPYWVRCDACGRMGQAGDESTCACGEILPEHPAYW